jgi:hypothetical protein
MASARFSPRPGLKKLDCGIRQTSPTYGRPEFLTHAFKAGGGLAVESASERLFAQLLGLDPRVRSFEPQPLTVDLLHGTLLSSTEEKARARKRDRVRGEPSIFYTPDFMLRWSSGSQTAVEVKTEGWEGDEQYQKTLCRVRESLRGHGIGFSCVVIPASWRHPLLTNVPLLHQAARRPDLLPDPMLLERAEGVANNGASTLGEFCSGLGLEMRMGPVLVVFGVLATVVQAHLFKSDTPASLAYGNLDHLCVWDALAQ